MVAEADPLGLLAAAGYTRILATHSELEFERYLHPGDRLQSSTVLESISERKSTALGRGYFVTWVSSYTDAGGKVVGRQRFRVCKFAPGGAGAVDPAGPARTQPSRDGVPGEELRVISGRVVAAPSAPGRRRVAPQ